MLAAFDESTPLLRKTSCALSFAHGRQLQEVATSAQEGRGLVVESITGRAAVVSGSPDEQPRYYLQHAFGFQVHDAPHPHHKGQHGRARHRVGGDRGMTDWTALSYVVVDVEGNGQQPPELVELAVVPIKGGVPGEQQSWLVRPSHPIKHLATAFHGIRTHDVAGCPPVAGIAAEALAALDAPAAQAHDRGHSEPVIQLSRTGASAATANSGQVQRAGCSAANCAPALPAASRVPAIVPRPWSASLPREYLLIRVDIVTGKYVGQRHFLA